MTLRMTASSTGAVASDFSGTATLSGEGHAGLGFSGSFRGKPQHVLFTIDGTQLAAIGDHAFAMEVPAESERNLRLVLFRLGLLHNLAMLPADQPPDGLDDAEGGSPTYRYTLLVGGEKLGEGALSVDPATALPLERHLTVHFPKGDLLVHETYTTLP
jgi:hypothetical protein